MRITLATVLLGLACVSPASAADWSPLRDMSLTEEDINRADGALYLLYAAGKTDVDAPWSNHASGNSGTARIVSLYETDGASCRRVEHVVRLRDQVGSKRVVFDSCLGSDSIWRASNRTGFLPTPEPVPPVDFFRPVITTP